MLTLETGDQWRDKRRNEALEDAFRFLRGFLKRVSAFAELQ